VKWKTWSELTRLLHRRWFPYLVFVIACLAGVLGVLIAAQLPHPGGDPKGLGLRTLEQVRAALPSGATSASIRLTASTWYAGGQCPGAADGWLPDQVTVDFRDSASPKQLASDVGAQLVHLGWVAHRHPLEPPEWVRPIIKGNNALAIVFLDGSGHSWELAALWSPPGPNARECP